MNRLPCSVGVGIPQSQNHMQPMHGPSIVPGSVNMPGIIPSGISSPVHGVQIPVQHEREHMIATAGGGGFPGHNLPPMGPNPNMHHIPNMLPHGHPHQFHHPHSVLALNRFHFVGQPELRIFEMNKRLQQRPEDCDSLWWEAFTSDFFDDDATLTLSFITTDDGPKRYTIGRALIPRYFRSIFESGCCELYYNLRLTHEYLHHTSIFLDSESTTMTMNMMRNVHTTVFVEGHLTLEFNFDELMRIRTWTFTIRSHREMIWRQMLSVQNPALQEQIPKNITRYGMTPSTLNFFRLCVILEPMQELMSRQKAYSLSPRECLKTTLYQKWQRLHPQESARQPSKRRKRKGSATTAADGSSNNSVGRASKRKQSPLLVPQHHIAQPGDVMIVGEPTLMGGDFGDEDERLITRLENTQYEVNMGNLQTGPQVSSNLHHHLFSNEQLPPVSLLSPPPASSGSGNNGMLNAGPPMQQQFRGSLLSNNSQLVMGMNDPGIVNSNSISPLQQQSPYQSAGVPVSLVPGQHMALPGGRVFPHPQQSMGTQPYGMPGRSLSGSNTPSSRDLYYTSAPSGSVDSVLPSGRASSTSSLMEVGNGIVGFTTCSSPNMLPSRSARFTPPAMSNGLGASLPPLPHHHQQPLPPHSTNFIMTPEMMNCVTSMPNVSMGSPLPVTSTSYTPDTMDGGISLMHPPMTPSGVLPPCGSNNMKPTNSPIVFSCIGSNGGQMPPESSLASMMTGPVCDPLMAMQIADDEMKPPMTMPHIRPSS